MDIIIINRKPLNILFFSIFISNNLFAASDVKVKELTPTISVGLTYTDNVDLTHTDEDSDLVTEVNLSLGDAGAGLSTQGSRLRTQLNYSLSGLSYDSDSTFNDWNHNLSSSATAEIVKNAVFLDAFANTRGVLLDQNRGGSEDRISGSDNITDTYNYGLTASWRNRWKNYASSNIRFAYDEVKFSDSSESDSKGNRFNISLINGPRFNEYFWNVNYNYNKTKYDQTYSDTSNEVAYMTLGYHFTRLLDFRVRFGYEDYDSSIDDGFGWTVGGTWRPSPRTSLDASWGERAFGRTAFLDFSHRAKKITWQLNYSDEITNSRSRLIDDSLSINDINANPDEDQQSNINSINVPLATYNPDLYLTRRLTGSASYPFKRSNLSVSVYTERLYYDDADEENIDNQGATLNWNFRLGGKTSMNTRLSWDRFEDLDIGNTQHRKRFYLSLSKQIFTTMTARINYVYTTNDADIRETEYDENRITASISKTFR